MSFLVPKSVLCLLSELTDSLRGASSKRNLKGQGQNKGKKDKSMMPEIKGRSGSFNIISLFEQVSLPSLTFTLYLYCTWKMLELKNTIFKSK